MRFIIISISACLIFSAGTLHADPAPTHALWEDGAAAYQKGDFQSAANSWEKWISSEAPRKSAQAYYNLAVAYCGANQYGRAMFSLLESTNMRFSPRRIWSELRLAKSIEKKIGIKDGASQQHTFDLFFLLNRNVVAYLMALGFWAFALLGLFKLSGRFKFAPVIITGLFGVIAISLAAVGWINRQFVWRPAVLENKNGGIALMKKPNENPADKLVDLPAGTIVNLVSSDEITDAKFVEIDTPLAGWVAKKSIIELE